MRRRPPAGITAAGAVQHGPKSWPQPGCASGRTATPRSWPPYSRRAVAHRQAERHAAFGLRRDILGARNMRGQVRIGRLVIDDEAHIDRDACPSCPCGTSTVQLWPPSRDAASYSVTRWRLPSSQAQDKPADAAADDANIDGPARTVVHRAIPAISRIGQSLPVPRMDPRASHHAITTLTRHGAVSGCAVTRLSQGHQPFSIW